MMRCAPAGWPAICAVRGRNGSGCWARAGWRAAALRRSGTRASNPAAFIDIDPHKIGQQVPLRAGDARRVPVLSRQALPPPGTGLLLNALTAHGAAEEAAAWLKGAGYAPEDWLLV